MRNFLIILQTLMISSLFAQTSPGGGGSPTPPDINQTVIYNEREVISYFLSNPSDVYTTDQTELVTILPRKKLRSYKYVWGALGYSHSEIKNSTPLNEGDDFVFPNTTVILKNGTLERKNATGVVFMKDTLKGITVPDAMYKARKVFNTSPSAAIPVGYTFVPVLDRGTLDALATNGYIVNSTTTRLSVENAWTKTTWDNTTKTITTVVNDPSDKNMIEEINTIYYSIVGNTLTKLKDVTQQFRRMHSGICFMEVSTKTFSGVVNSVDGSIQQRNDDATNVDKISVYPNPSRNEFILSPTDDTDLIEKVQLFDISGKPVAMEVSDGTFGTKRITMKSEFSGIYLLKYMIANKTYTQKIIKI